MKSTPTAAMEVLLNLTLLDLWIMAEARMALYRLQILKQPTVPKTVSGVLSIWKNVGDPILDMRSDYTIPVYYHSKIFRVIIDRDYWRNKDPVFPEDALIWFTDGSRTGSGIFGVRPNRSFSVPLGKYATDFQTEIYAVLQCACETIRRAYKHKRILIFSDSQAALRALIRPKVTSRLVAECLDALSALACLNEVTLIWVPGHCGIPGNEEADKLARQVSAMLLLGPEPALGIPRCSAREAVKNWTKRQHYNAWRDLPVHRHGKLFIGRPCKRRADDLLKLSRHQLKTAVAVLMGHAPVRRHLYIMGLFDGDPTCRFCGIETATVQHIICYCEALARQRYNVFRKLFVEPKDASSASVRDLCLYIGGIGLLNLCSMECLRLHNKPKAAVHPGHKLMGPKEEEEGEDKIDINRNVLTFLTLIPIKIFSHSLPQCLCLML
jgi:ribonuclease HI